MLVWSGLAAQGFSVSTNMLGYADLGTLNIEASYGVDRHWSVAAGLKYNPFTYDPDGDSVRRRQRSVSAGTRYWPWHIFSGWWLSAGLRYQEYNSGGASSPVTTEGDRFGASFGGGYSYMITPRINLDFGLALWSGYDLYTAYSCPDCGRKIDEGGKFFILPADLMLALTFIF